jgi:hypothetical protein
MPSSPMKFSLMYRLCSFGQHLEPSIDTIARILCSADLFAFT